MKSLLGSFLMTREVDVHQIQNKFSRIGAEGHWKTKRLEVGLNSFNGAEIEWLPAREKEKLVEHLDFIQVSVEYYET